MRETERKPNPPRLGGRETRRSESSERGLERERRLEKIPTTWESNHEAAGERMSGGVTLDRKDKRGRTAERRRTKA